MDREWIAEKLNEWIDHDHDFSRESINQFCLENSFSYDEYMALWYEVCGCIEEDQIMWEFEMYNINTGEIEIVYGYSLADARERSPKYENREWICLMSTYID